MTISGRAKKLMAAGIHPNSIGYSDIASAVAKIITQ